MFSFNFIVSIYMYATLVTIGNISIEEYGASPSMAGFIASIFIIGVLTGRALTGYLVDNYGAKKFVYIGTILFFATYVLYFIDIGIYFLMIVRLLSGVSAGVISTALNTLVAVSVPNDRRGEGISYFSLSMVLGSAIGPFSAFILLEHISFNTMLMYIGIIIIVISFMLPLIKVSNTYESTVRKTSKFVIVSKEVLPIGMSILFMGFAYSAVLSFINLFAIENNLITAAGFFFLVYSVAVLITRPITGKILDKHGANIILYPAFIIMAIGFFILGQSSTSIVLLISGFLIGLGFGNFQSIAQAVCIKIVKKENIGLASSTFFIMMEFGIGFGPLFLGMIVPIVGYGGLYHLLIFCILIAMAIFYFVYSRFEKE